MPSRPSARRTRATTVLAASAIAALALTGCSPIVDTFNSLQAATSGGGVVVTPGPSPSPSMPFESMTAIFPPQPHPPAARSTAAAER